MKNLLSATDKWIIVHCWDRATGKQETHEFKSRKAARDFARNVGEDIRAGRGEWKQVTLETSTKTTWEMR